MSGTYERSTRTTSTDSQLSSERLCRLLNKLFAICITSTIMLPATTLLGVEIVNKRSGEHLISLRDYDFVGEDARLARALTARLAVLQAPLQPQPPPPPPPPPPRRPPAPPLRRDLLPLSLRGYPRVNVSLDYGELPAADLSLEANPLWPAPPGLEPPGPESSGPASRVGNLAASRRKPGYHDPSYRQNNLKILELMRQKIYTMQEKLVDLEPVIKKYEGDPRFRMAYIFRQLDDWLKSMRGVYFAMSKWSNTASNRFKRRIWSYEHALRRNIDVTYTVDYLAHVHATYIKQMEDIMPAAQREEMQKERDRMLELQEKNKQAG